MYSVLKNKLNDLQKTIDIAIDSSNNPQIVIVQKQEDNTYKIIEIYYKRKKGNRVEFITDDYKKVLEKYTSNKTRVIINDLI